MGQPDRVGAGKGRDQASAGIEGCGGFEDPERVGDVEREDGNGVERPAGWNHPGRGQDAKGGFEPDDFVQRGRHAPRACCVGAKRKRDKPRRDRDRGPGARAAWNQTRAERVARNAIGGTYSDETRRELVEIRLPDHDRPGALEALDDEGRTLGRVGEGRASGGRRQTSDVDVVLDGERYAKQRPAGRSFVLQLSAAANASAFGRSVMKSAGSAWRPMRSYVSSIVAVRGLPFA